MRQFTTEFCGFKYYNPFLIYRDETFIFGFHLKLILKVANEIKAQSRARAPNGRNNSKGALPDLAWMNPIDQRLL